MKKKKSPYVNKLYTFVLCASSCIFLCFMFQVVISSIVFVLNRHTDVPSILLSFFFFLFPSPPAFPGHPPRPPSSFNFLCLRLSSLSTHLPTKLENVAMVSGGKKFVFDTAIYCISSNRILLSIFF